MMKKYFKLFFLSVCLSFTILFFSFGFSQQALALPAETLDFQNKVGESAGFDVKTTKNIPALIYQIMKAGMGLLGVIFMILMIYSGVRWMTAGGRTEVIDQAQSNIRNSIIGLALVLGAYSLSIFVVKALLGVT